MDMIWLNAAVKGVVEGVTEFLPISSTGHLILLRDIFPLGDPASPSRKAMEDTFDIVVQLPAVMAIVALYRRRLWAAAAGAARDSSARKFWFGLLLAFIPSAVAGLLAHRWIEERLFRPEVIAAALLAGGVVIIAFERWGHAGSGETAEKTPLPKAVSIGLFQCLALIPGTSRSAATIIGGRAMGLSREAAAEYSFFLALPTMFAACGYKLFKALRGGEIEWQGAAGPLLIGSLFSFAAAYVVVAGFMHFLRTRTLAAFGWYRIALGSLVLAMWLAGWFRQ